MGISVVHILYSPSWSLWIGSCRGWGRKKERYFLQYDFWVDHPSILKFLTGTNGLFYAAYLSRRCLQRDNWCTSICWSGRDGTLLNPECQRCKVSVIATENHQLVTELEERTHFFSFFFEIMSDHTVKNRVLSMRCYWQQWVLISFLVLETK